MKELKVKNLDNEFLNIESDFFLPFFGLSANLGPIKEWELEIEKSCLKDSETKIPYVLNPLRPTDVRRTSTRLTSDERPARERRTSPGKPQAFVLTNAILCSRSELPECSQAFLLEIQIR